MALTLHNKTIIYYIAFVKAIYRTNEKQQVISDQYNDTGVSKGKHFEFNGGCISGANFRNPNNEL